jgi:cytochrome b subunit of formate dehydrogenase
MTPIWINISLTRRGPATEQNTGVLLMKKARLITHWLLLAVSLLFLVSGFGISQFRTVEALTGGLFGKALAFKMHEALWIPFVVLLVLHIYFSLIIRLRKKKAAAGSTSETN